MSTLEDSRESLAEAEALYESARSCRSAEEAAKIKGKLIIRLQDYVSMTNSYSPAVYKVLQNAVKLLESHERAASVRPSFRFKSVQTREPPKAEVTQVSVQPPTAEAKKPADNHTCDSGVRLQDGTLYICKLKGLDIVRSKDELVNVGRVILKDLDGCRVVLLGVVETVYISNLKNSLAWIGISRGSVISESLINSKIISCCRQLRIADSMMTKFLIDAVTPPIIERSSDISFARNHIRYDGQMEQLESSGLKDLLLSGVPTAIDFSWHHASPSPNWTAEQERTPLTVSTDTLDCPAGEPTGNTVTFTSDSWDILQFK
ncbi:Tubulin-folding cofactor C [Babesia sp. Xinjiang]|uniref:Tubulin-folding cofactor C n=1 Tax=Babesia sp. Xinjiang TaxID=462227 RepID=UPI000A234EB6|nr:Tubulin-folding cofactor C [Babesia sp. Xinjiang]ORM40552.1 Tubulin-folding cofactor C [Babesia sp. Xinjiang]